MGRRRSSWGRRFRSFAMKSATRASSRRAPPSTSRPRPRSRTERSARRASMSAATASCPKSNRVAPSPRLRERGRFHKLRLVWLRPPYKCSVVESRVRAVLNVQGFRLHEPSCHQAAESREYQEQPHLCEGDATHKNRGAEAARGIDRQSGHVDEREMQHRESQPDDKAGHRCRAFFAGGAKDYESEQEGCDELRQRRGDEVKASEIVRAPSILTQTGARHIVAGDLAL